MNLLQHGETGGSSFCLLQLLPRCPVSLRPGGVAVLRNRVFCGHTRNSWAIPSGVLILGMKRREKYSCLLTKVYSYWKATSSPPSLLSPFYKMEWTLICYADSSGMTSWLILLWDSSRTFCPARWEASPVGDTKDTGKCPHHLMSYLSSHAQLSGWAHSQWMALLCLVFFLITISCPMSRCPVLFLSWPPSFGGTAFAMLSTSSSLPSKRSLCTSVWLCCPAITSVCLFLSLSVFTHLSNLTNSPQAFHVILDTCLPGRLSAPLGLQEKVRGSLLLRQVRQSSPRLFNELQLWPWGTGK